MLQYQNISYGPFRLFFMHYIQHCFIGRPSDSTCVGMTLGLEPSGIFEQSIGGYEPRMYRVVIPDRNIGLKSIPGFLKGLKIQSQDCVSSQMIQSLSYSRCD